MQASRLELVAKEIDELKSKKIPNIDFEAYMKAREEDKANVKPSSDYEDQLIEYLSGEHKFSGATLPWSKTHETFRFRRGEITTWVGFNGHMKSMLTGFVALDLVKQAEVVAIASFEMRPVSTLGRLTKQAIGNSNPTSAYVKKFFEWSGKNLWFYDQQGTVNSDRLLGVIYYAAEQLGVTHFFVDSLMKCVPDEDDMNGQKRFIDKLCAAAKDLNIHIHVIHHSRKKDNERTRPGKQDAKGSGSIVDQTDNFMVVYKIHDDDKKEDSPDFVLYCDKQRHGEWEGSIPLWLHQQSLQFLPGSNLYPMTFL